MLPHVVIDAPDEAVEATEAEEVTKESEDASAVYSVQTPGNEIAWEGFETFTDKVHKGYIQVSKGELRFEGNELKGGQFTIDMTSMKNTDLPKEGDYNQAKLEGHLKSPDFFAVDSFPTAKFEITKVMAAPDTMGNASHMLKGNLTMRGITKNITVPAQVEMMDNKVSLTTPQFVIDRSQWNVKFRSKSFAELLTWPKTKLLITISG
ncbi:MAG: YceI family protein [Owenweeksia sp.]|nr:YceI family protein [Owenweeksia sp.]